MKSIVSICKLCGCPLREDGLHCCPVDQLGEERAQMREMSWKEFTELGYLWWVNRILHTFGFAIVTEADEETGEVRRAYPARVSYFGFPREVDEEKLDAFRGSIEHPKAHVEDRLRAERDRLRNEVVQLRGHGKHDYKLVNENTPEGLAQTRLFRCANCGQESNAPVHAYFNPCTGTS